MENELANYNDTFAAFQAAADALQGESQPILKFNKGKWLFGQDDERFEVGKTFGANINEASWGWIFWRDGKPEERRMVRIATGQRPAMRTDLGHLDEALWEREKNDDGSEGAPIDPWQKSFEIPCRETDGDMREFIMAGRSRGFEGAFKKLVSQFGREMRANEGKVPLVMIGADDYKHSNPKFGIIDTPIMKISSWVDLEFGVDGDDVPMIEDQSGDDEPKTKKAKF